MKKRTVILALCALVLLVPTGIVLAKTPAGGRQFQESKQETAAAEDQEESFVDVNSLSEAELTELATAIDPQMVAEYSALTKDNIYYKMLNTVDFFNTASGEVTNCSQSGEFSVDFSVNMISAQTYEKVEAEETDIEVYCEDGLAYTFNNLAETKHVRLSMPSKMRLTRMALKDSADTKIVMDSSDRITIESDGNKGYHYRQNTTNAFYSSSLCLFPQELASGYLSDQSLWEITGQINYLGRNCAVINGTADPAYGAKLNVNTFIMYVDTETGILLKYEGFDESGEKTDFIEVSQFTLNPVASRSFISLNSYESYTSLNSPEELQAYEELKAQN